MLVARWTENSGLLSSSIHDLDPKAYINLYPPQVKDSMVSIQYVGIAPMSSPYPILVQNETRERRSAITLSTIQSDDLMIMEREMEKQIEPKVVADQFAIALELLLNGLTKGRNPSYRSQRKTPPV